MLPIIFTKLVPDKPYVLPIKLPVKLPLNVAACTFVTCIAVTIILGVAGLVGVVPGPIYSKLTLVLSACQITS